MHIEYVVDVLQLTITLFAKSIDVHVMTLLVIAIDTFVNIRSRL